MSHRLLFLLFALLLPLGVVSLSACSDRQTAALPTVSDTETNTPPVLPPLDMYPPGYMAENDAVTLTFEPSDQKTTGTVYRVVYPELNEQYAQEFASKLGVQGEVRYDDSAGYPVYKIEDGDVSLHVMQGGFNYFASNRPSFGQPSSDFSEAKATDKAKGFLSEHGLLPDDAEFGEASLSQDGSISVGAGNKSFPVLFAVFPYFPPFGISITFDPQGNIDDISYFWPNVEKVGEYPLLSEREAHQDMLSHPTESAQGTTVTITSFVLSYYTSTDAEGTSYLVPVYCAMGVRDRKSGDDETGCIAPVPALPESQMRRGYPDWAPGKETPTP